MNEASVTYLGSDKMSNERQSVVKSFIAQLESFITALFGWQHVNTKTCLVVTSSDTVSCFDASEKVKFMKINLESPSDTIELFVFSSAPHAVVGCLNEVCFFSNNKTATWWHCKYLIKRRRLWRWWTKRDSRYHRELWNVCHSASRSLVWNVHVVQSKSLKPSRFRNRRSYHKTNLLIMTFFFLIIAD